MNYMNGYPANGHFNNNNPNNSQWQQMTRSPNSMGNNGSPSGITPSSSMNMPTVPSPLLNSVNSNSIGIGGTPQQQSVKTPSSVHQQPSNSGLLTLRNPFEEDLEFRPASRQRMPPPTNNNQRLYFDMVKEFR
jgi:hypothetical protein